jgi:choline dehydrogenase
MDKKLDRTIALTVVLNHPRSRGSVKLRSADPNDKPVIDLGCLDAPEDMSRLVDG